MDLLINVNITFFVRLPPDQSQSGKFLINKLISPQEKPRGLPYGARLEFGAFLRGTTIVAQ